MSSHPLLISAVLVSAFVIIFGPVGVPGQSSDQKTLSTGSISGLVTVGGSRPPGSP